MTGRYREGVREVTVVVSDPWSFVDDQGSNIFKATVRESEGELLLLTLNGQHYVATPRRGVGFSLTPVTEEQAQQAPPWGRDDWRGQPTALLADLRDV